MGNLCIQRILALTVAVNDVVLFHAWDKSPELSYNDSKPHIMVIYNQEEVTQLKSHGVKITDCPPELLPGGYYGWLQGGEEDKKETR